MTELFAALAEDPERLREAVRLPAPETTRELPADQREALLEVAEIIAARWHAQWTRAASGWMLLLKLAKAMRHGCRSSRAKSSWTLPGLAHSAMASTTSSSGGCSWWRRRATTGLDARHVVRHRRHR